LRRCRHAPSRIEPHGFLVRPARRGHECGGSCPRSGGFYLGTARARRRRAWRRLPRGHELIEKKERPPNDPRRIGSSADFLRWRTQRGNAFGGRSSLVTEFGVEIRHLSSDIVRGGRSRLRVRSLTCAPRCACATPPRAGVASDARARFARASRFGSTACLSRHGPANA